MWMRQLLRRDIPDGLFETLVELEVESMKDVMDMPFPVHSLELARQEKLAFLMSLKHALYPVCSGHNV